MAGSGRPEPGTRQWPVRSTLIYGLEEPELRYAPQFGSANDPVNFAGMVAADVLRGDMPIGHWDGAGKSFLLDVCEIFELAVEQVPDALNIPLGQLSSRQGELPRDKEILVICQSGQRAYSATRVLLQEGLKARNLAGGMLSRADAETFWTWSVTRCSTPRFASSASPGPVGPKSLSHCRLPDLVVRAFASPLAIQSKHAEAIHAALERDTAGVLQRAQEVISEGSCLRPPQVVSRLIGQASAPGHSSQVKMLGRQLGTWTVSRQGKVVVTLERTVAGPADIHKVVAALGALLPKPGSRG